jgi:hypothetical protein
MKLEAIASSVNATRLNAAKDLGVEELSPTGQPDQTIRYGCIEKRNAITRQQVAWLAQTPTEPAEVPLEGEPGDQRGDSRAPHESHNEERATGPDVTPRDDLVVEDRARGKSEQQKGDDLLSGSQWNSSRISSLDLRIKR